MPVREVLIVLMGSLGDVARGLAVAKPIKRRYPEARLTWLIDRRWEPIVRMNPAVDDVIVFDRSRGARAFLDVRQALSRHRIDLALDLQRHFKSGVCTWLSRAPRRIGFARRNAKEFNWLFQTEHIPEVTDHESKVHHYFEFARACGVEPSACDPSLAFDTGLGDAHPTAEESEKLASLPPRYVAAVIGSSWQSKDWFAEGYARVISALGAHPGVPVVLLGDGRQTAVAAEIAKQTGALDWVQRTSLRELVFLLARATAAFGPDSGPGHLAAAVGTPYIAVFGPTDPARVAPWRMERFAVRGAIGCSPCWRRTCPGLDRLCMRLASANDVVTNIRDAIGADRPG